MNKKRIMCAQELGSSLDHMVEIRHIALELKMRGHDVCIVVKELHNTALVFSDEDEFAIFPAPVWLPLARRKSRNTSCFAKILLDNGYDDTIGLGGLLMAWQGLFISWEPDLLIANFSPTALFAAKFFKFKTITSGIGFGDLAPGTHAPKLLSPNQQQLVDVPMLESEALTTVNALAKEYGLPVFNYLSDICKADATIITNIQELDINSENRKEATYVGPLFNGSLASKTLSFPKTGRQFKVFAYIKANQPYFDLVMRVLYNIDAEVIVYIANTPVNFVTNPPDNLLATYTPIDLSIFEHCDLCICEVSTTLTRALISGIPVLACPTQPEQIFGAMKGLRTGALHFISESDNFASASSKTMQLLMDSKYKNSAEIIRSRYQHLQGGTGLMHFANTCEQLLNCD